MRKKHLDWQGGKWKSAASGENSLSAGFEAGRYLVNRKPASLTGTQGTKRGDARYRLLSTRSLLGLYSKSTW